jgi:4-amino-4-deoxychorismate lyase
MLVGLLDGRLVPADQPLLRPDDAGVVRGDGVFETTLVVDGQPRDLDEHLARLDRSAAMTDLELPPAADWRKGIAAVLGGWTGADMVLRLIATRGPESGRPTCYVTGAPVSPTAIAQRTAGVRVLLLDRGFTGSAAVASPWLLAGAKTLSYSINMAALRYAAGHDADDVIFVGADGTVLEAPTATVVVARDRTLTTPPEQGVLAGITVERLFAAARAAGWSTDRRPLLPEDLHSADGVWLASSVRLLAPVVSIDGSALPAAVGTAELLGLLGCP